MPRGGGVVEQPHTEIRKLEAVLSAYTKYEEVEMRKNRARDMNRRRHAPNIERTVEV